MEQYRRGMIFNNMGTMVPWFSKLIDEDRSVLGDDWWPYGIEANRKAVDVILALPFRARSLETAIVVRGHLRARAARNVTPTSSPLPLESHWLQEAIL